MLGRYCNGDSLKMAELRERYSVWVIYIVIPVRLVSVFRLSPALPVTRLLKVIDFIQDNFLGATLPEKQNAKMRFEFPRQDGQNLAQMFGFIEVRRNSPVFVVDHYGNSPLPPCWASLALELLNPEHYTRGINCSCRIVEPRALYVGH